MPLSREDATRIARFCLAGSGWGTALREDEACVVKIIRSSQGEDTHVYRFEGGSFEEALRQAAAGGALNAASLEKQISFLGRALPSRRGEGGGDTPAAPTAFLSSEGVFPLLTQAISSYLNQAQRERGISALCVASRGRLFASRLRLQWKATDRELAGLLALHERHRAVLPPETLQRLHRAEGIANKIADGRRVIESLGTSALEVIAAYTLMNAEFLAVVDSLAIRSVAMAARPTALAWMALLHAKEKTGIERAQLASVFAADRYAVGQQAVVSALIASSESYLHLFSAAAPPVAEDLLRRTLKSDVAEAVAAMEKVALDRYDGHFGIDPEAWFTTVSRKMDLFGDVEAAVRVSMPQE